MKSKSLTYTPGKANLSGCRTMSIRLSQSQQTMLRREAKRRGWRIRDLISRSVKFYIANEEQNGN